MPHRSVIKRPEIIAQGLTPKELFRLKSTSEPLSFSALLFHVGIVGGLEYRVTYIGQKPDAATKPRPQQQGPWIAIGPNVVVKKNVTFGIAQDLAVDVPAMTNYDIENLGAIEEYVLEVRSTAGPLEITAIVSQFQQQGNVFV
jgi:hypothetical protein